MASAADPGTVIETDALVIGAGPVGLFQVFQLGLQDVHAHVVDALPYPGGQCIELYADKPIYDIPAIPVCTGRELIQNLLTQVAPFKPTFHLGQLVTTLAPQADGRFLVETSQARRFLAKTVFIAAGVGAFLPRTLHLEGLAGLEGTQLLHQVSDAAQLVGKNVVIFGDGEDALDWALRLSTPQAHEQSLRPATVTLVHRREVFSAAPETVERFKARVQQGSLHFAPGQATGIDTVQGVLRAVHLLGPDGTTRAMPADVLLVLQGLSPKLGPVAHWGLALERKQLPVDTETFSTSVPGIFAVGDINTYPGKKKLILCGFHECVLAAFAAVCVIDPARRVLLQYTTTSPKLHKLLGVDAQDTSTSENQQKTAL